MLHSKKNVHGYRFEAGQFESSEIQAITEAPVTLTVNGDEWLVFLCTPVDLEALAVGFLFNEGLLHSKDEIASVKVCTTGEMVDVWLNHAVEKPAQWRRTSGCTGGVTGVNNQDDLVSPIAGFEPGPAQNTGEYEVRFSPQEITALVAQLSAVQDLYPSTGGVHSSALSDGQKILIAVEDIGRHNTLDKIAGRYVLDEIHPLRRVLITTGRISSEMLQKAARIGAAVVISRTAPSSLSIEMAEQLGVTLIGYARRDRFTVYCHPERIIVGPSQATLP